MVGIVPQEDVVHGELTVEESLRFAGRLRFPSDVGASAIQREVDRVLDELGITHIRGSRIGSALKRGISGGQRKRVNLGQELLTRTTRVLFLDEPTSGLDPQLQHEFLTLLRERSEEGATVFMSSHVLREVESVADRVGVIKDGRMVDVDSVAGLRRRAGQRVRFRFSEPPDPDAVLALAGVEAVKVVSDTLECIVHGEPDALLKWAARFEVIEWHARDRDLEELFLDVYRNHGAPHAP
jgi:ABC-2 type transport system ATP-binding protein